MKITADTNVLVRAMTGDDPVQSKIAQAELANADMVALALPALCELVWVLSRGYKIPSPDIAGAIRRLINATNVAVNRPAAEAGLALPKRAATLPMGSSHMKGTGSAPRPLCPSTGRRWNW